MNGTLLQQKIYYGYAIAAQKIGNAFSQYRAASPINPIVNGNLLTSSFLASFNVDWKYSKASQWGKVIYQCLGNGAVMRVGDFLISAAQTFFIVAMEPLLPIIAAQCNAVASVERPFISNAVGDVGYSGYVPQSTRTVLMSNIPMSIIEDTRKSSNPTKLPTDTACNNWIISIPNLDGTLLQVGDSIINGNDIYSIEAPELTSYGWRIRAIRAVV